MSDDRQQREIDELRLRLEEAEDTIRAIRQGSVDAFVIEDIHGRQVYTLEGADRPYRLLVERMQQGAVTLSADGDIAYANQRCADLLGVPLGRLPGAALRGYVAPADRPAYDELLRGGAAGASQGEVSFHRNGEPAPVFLTCNALPSDTGAAVGVLLTDLTAQKHQERLAAAHEALRASQEALGVQTARVRRLADASLRVNAAGGVEAVSRVLAGEARSLFGTHRASVGLEAGERGEAVHAESVSEGYVARPGGRLTAPLRGHGGRDFGLLVVADRADGGDFDEDDEAILSQLAAIAAVALENARLYDELRRMDRAKDEFMATLAHELRNPLAPIRNSLEVIRLSPDRADWDQARETMERQLAQMVRLVDDLLDISRVTRGKVELRKERVELAAVLRGAIETSRPLIEAQRHRLTLRLPPEPVWLDADPTRLAQVVSNLLNNAAKYTEGEGQIWLAAERAGGEVTIRVRDSGIGIPREMLPRVFDLFTQVDTALERAQGGLGIGLTLVRTLTRMHGGEVEARSDGLGCGSEFVVRLPAAADAPARGEGPAEKRAKSPPRRVLAVDDNVDSARSLGKLLTILGHDVRLAHDGPKALEAASAFAPEVVLLDIGLPGMNGYEVARRLRESAESRRAVLIAVTGWGQEEDRRHSREAGFDYHMTKPVDLRALETLLASLGPARS